MTAIELYIPGFQHLRVFTQVVQLRPNKIVSIPILEMVNGSFNEIRLVVVAHAWPAGVVMRISTLPKETSGNKPHAAFSSAEPPGLSVSPSLPLSS